MEVTLLNVFSRSLGKFSVIEENNSESTKMAGSEVEVTFF